MLTKQLALSTTHSSQTPELEDLFTGLIRDEGVPAHLLPGTTDGIKTFAKTIAPYPLNNILPLCLTVLKASDIYISLIQKLLREFTSDHIHKYVHTEDIQTLHHHMTCFLLYDQIEFVSQCLAQIDDPKKKDALQLRLSLYIPSEICPKYSNISFLHLGIIQANFELIELALKFPKAREIPVRKKTIFCHDPDTSAFTRTQVTKGSKAIHLAALFANKDLFLRLLKQECERTLKQGPLTEEGIHSLIKQLEILVTQDSVSHKRTIIEAMVDSQLKGTDLYTIFTTPLLQTPNEDATLKKALGWTREVFIEKAKQAFKIDFLDLLLKPLDKTTQTKHIKDLHKLVQDSISVPEPTKTEEELSEENESAMIFFAPWFEGEDKYREISTLTRPYLLRQMIEKKRSDIFFKFVAIFMIEHRHIHDMSIEDLQEILDEFIQDMTRHKTQFEKIIEHQKKQLPTLRKQKTRHHKSHSKKLAPTQLEAIGKSLTIQKENQHNLSIARERIVIARQFKKGLTELRIALNEQLHNQAQKTEGIDTTCTETARHTPLLDSDTRIDDYVMVEPPSPTTSDTEEIRTTDRWQSFSEDLSKRQFSKHFQAIKGDLSETKHWQSFSEDLSKRQFSKHLQAIRHDLTATRHWQSFYNALLVSTNEMSQGDWTVVMSPTKGSKRWKRFIQKAQTRNRHDHHKHIISAHNTHQEHRHQTWQQMATQLTYLQNQRQRTTLFKAYKEEKVVQAFVPFQAHVRGQQTRQWFGSNKYNLAQQQLKREQRKVQELHEALQIMHKQNVQLMANEQRHLDFRAIHAHRLMTQQLISRQEPDGEHVYSGQFAGDLQHGEIEHTYPTGERHLEIWANGQFVTHLFEIQD